MIFVPVFWAHFSALEKSRSRWKMFIIRDTSSKDSREKWRRK